MAGRLDERAVLRTAQLGLVLAFGSNLVAGASLIVAARSLALAEEDARACARGAPPPVVDRGPASAPAPDPVPDERADPNAPAAAEPATVAAAAPAFSQVSRARMWSAPEDAAPTELGGMRDEVYGRHYLASDEWNPHLFFELARERGGAYVGVGTDQAYLLAGWARADLAFAIDYDPMVVALHRVYRAFFREARTPGEFVELWSVGNRRRALRLLHELYPDAAERGPPRTAYLRARIRVSRRLEGLTHRLEAARVPSWLTDQAQYEHVRALVLEERLRPMLVDLTGTRGLSGIGAAARDLGVPVRVLYLSNAEQYWKYGAAFRDNVAALPFDERSVVLRTISSRKANGDYRYNVHAGLDFQAQLKVPENRQVYQFVELRRIGGRGDVPFSVTGDVVPAAGSPAGAQTVTLGAVASSAASDARLASSPHGD